MVAAALAAVFLISTVVVAVDRNDKSVFPPVLPAAIGIAAFVLAVVFVRRRSQIRAFTMTGAGHDRGRGHALCRACFRG